MAVFGEHVDVEFLAAAVEEVDRIDGLYGGCTWNDALPLVVAWIKAYKAGRFADRADEIGRLCVFCRWLRLWLWLHGRVQRRFVGLAVLAPTAAVVLCGLPWLAPLGLLVLVGAYWFHAAGERRLARLLSHSSRGQKGFKQ